MFAATAATRGSSSSSAASERSAARQDGSSASTGMPASAYRCSVATVPRRILRAASSWPVLIQVSAAAGALGDHPDAQPGPLEDPDRGAGALRGEVVGEGVGPHHHVGDVVPLEGSSPPPV